MTKPRAATILDEETLAIAARDDETPGTFANELATALAEVKAKLDSRHALKARQPLFTDAVELLQRQFDGARWLVTGLITTGGIVTVGGLPKAAKKTWLLTEIAVAIATGTKVCGEFDAEQGAVAYFYAEDGGPQVQTKVRAVTGWSKPTTAGGRTPPAAPRRIHRRDSR